MLGFKIKGVKLIVYFILGLLFILFAGLFYEADKEKNNNNNNGVSLRCTEGKIDEQAIDNYLKGAFKGKTDAFIKAGRENSIDPVLLAAIAIHETGNGTSPAVRNKNNPGGLMNPQTNWSTLMHFATLEEGINAMASNLNRLYISQGLITIEQIGNKYAPLGAANDPTNLNRHWVPTVTALSNKLGGLSMNCEVMGEGEFVLPTGNMTINSNYGWRSDPHTGERTFHKGTDFNCSGGDPIVAAQAGKIVVAVKSGWGGGYGHHVIIDHGDKYTLYGHMTSVIVNLNDAIGAGEQIGTCGTTGSSTGDHLHFEVQTGQIYGERHDPLPFFQKPKEDKEK